MSELNDLRRRSGIISEDETASAGVPPMSRAASMMQRLASAATGDVYGNELLEAGKVLHNLTTQELWMRLVNGYLKGRGV